MSTGTQTQTTATEIWTVATKRGPFYYREGYSTFSIRPVRVPAAEAELALATGRAALISKPAWH